LPSIDETPTLLIAPFEEKIVKFEAEPSYGVHCAYVGSRG